jgi:hypothetical protein
MLPPREPLPANLRTECPPLEPIPLWVDLGGLMEIHQRDAMLYRECAARHREAVRAAE